MVIEQQTIKQDKQHELTIQITTQLTLLTAVSQRSLTTRFFNTLDSALLKKKSAPCLRCVSRITVILYRISMISKSVIFKHN